MIQNLQTHTWFVIVGFGCKLIHFKFSIVGFGRARTHSWFTTVEMGNTILHSRLFFMWDLEVHHLASGLLSWFSEAHGLNRCSLFWDFVFFDILIHVLLFYYCYICLVSFCLCEWLFLHSSICLVFFLISFLCSADFI